MMGILEHLHHLLTGAGGSADPQLSQIYAGIYTQGRSSSPSPLEEHFRG